jgi:hypothetical protein
MKMHRKKISAAAVLIAVLLPGIIFAAGLFGPPQTVSRKDGGLNTAIGYWHYEDKLKDGGEYVLKQNQLYSHAGYGSRDIWEIYGRLGIADLKLENAFSPSDSLTSVSKTNMGDTWNNIFGTLGGKAFYPYNQIFGIGAFVQGTYFFNYFNDNTSGSRAGIPINAGVKLKDMWNLNIGVGGQMSTGDAKFYLGPYFYRTETRAYPSSSGIQFPHDTTLDSKANFGVFAGIDVPIGRGFRFNIESQYAERLSLGAAISFTY